MKSCKGCTRREVGCHGHCQIYKEEKAEHQKKQEALKRQRLDDAEILYRLYGRYKLYGGNKWHK